MNLTKVSIKRPLTITMIFLIVMMFGYIGYTKMPADLMPKMEIPVLTIQTMWPGAGPEDIDEQISKKIDEKVSAVSKIKKTRTISQESVSFVVVEFEYGTDVDKVLADVKSKVDELQQSLPKDAEKPQVLKIDVNAGAIGSLVITGGKSANDLMQYAEDVVQAKVKSADGVTSADIKGGEKSQINVTADPAVLSSYSVSLGTIKSTLEGSNKTAPYGSITQGEDKITLRGMDQLKSLEDIKQIQVSNNKGQSIRLDQICNVEYGTVEKEDLYRYDGVESLVIDVNKQQDANTVAVMNEVYKKVDELNKNNPGYTIKIANDTSEYIKTSVKNVMTEIFISSLISFIIILAFLKNIKASMAVALSIPTSIVGTLAVLYFTGETINIVTLSSMVLSVGIVVDNSIVVIENIFRNNEIDELSSEEAALQGTKTVTSAIVGSTLTIICVFLPILFTEGITKIMFGALAKTMISALAFSLIVAITLVPSIFNKLSGGKNATKMKEKPSPIFNKISEVYKKLIDYSLKHKAIVVIFSSALFAISIYGATFIGMDFMPASDKGKLNISIDVPEGLDLKPSDYYVSMAEKKISDIPEIKTVITSIKTSGRSNSAKINVELVPRKERKKETAEIEKEIIERMNTVPDCKVNVSLDDGVMSGGGGSGADFTLNLKGADLDTINVLAKQVQDKLSGISGFRNVETSIADTSREAQFSIDKQKANEHGINTLAVASLIKTAVDGDKVITAKIDDYEVDVKLKFKGSSIDNLDDIKQMKVMSKTGEEIPLGQIADIKMADGLKKISRNDGDYVIDITATLDGIDAGTASKQAMTEINELNLPRDYEASFGGNTSEMNESMGGLVYAMAIAIILVYMVMIAEFESFSKPFIIMTCIPFAFVGVVAILLITGTSLNIVGMLGGILLVGIVVNHGIVLIEYIEQLRESMDAPIEEIVAKGSAIRLRPVLMTTLTAALGMLPAALALEEGGEMMQPLAIVIMGGLSVSTLVTLVLIPVIYVIFDKLEKKFSNRIHKITGKISGKHEQIKEEKIMH